MGYYIAGSKIRPQMGRIFIILVVLGTALATTLFYRLNTFTAAAVTPPDSCFAFSAGTITAYHNYENNDSEQAACSKDVDVPSTIGGIPVTAIGDNAFDGRWLTSVSFPSSVQSIGNSAFMGNNLESIVFSEGLLSIGTSAFYDADITSISLPDSLTTVGEGAFQSAYSLSSIHIGSGLAHLPNNVFGDGGTTALKSVYIPSTVTSMSTGAFNNHKLETLVIGEADYSGLPVFDIPANAFNNHNISSLTLYSNVRSIGTSAFGQNQITAITYPDVIPETLESIGDTAFMWNPITEVSLPNLQYLGNMAFMGGTYDSLSICTPDFSGTPVLNLQMVNTPGGSTPLTSLTLGDCVLSIANDAFVSQSLTSVVIPDSVISIGASAFEHNNDLLASVVIGSGVQTVGDTAFGWNPIETVTVRGNPTLHVDAFAGSGPNYVSGEGGQGDSFIRMYATNADFIGNYGPGRIALNIDDSIRDGFIVNPATYTVNYRTSDGDTLLPSISSGISPTLTDYSFAANPTGDFSLYYLGGDEIPLSPPDVDDYVTPGAYNLTLAGGPNVYTFVYASVDSGGIEPTGEEVSDENLANTGVSWPAIIALSGFTIFGSIATVSVIRRRL